MKIKHQLSIATLLMAGVFVTGCSQQVAGGSQIAGGSQSQIEGGSQVTGSQQQVEGAAPVVAAPEVVAPKPRPVTKPRPVSKPKPRVNRWAHTHPAIPRCTKSVRHTHKYNQARHSHKYSCQNAAPRRAVQPQKPQVDVRALQLKLQAKGYYKGPIDGVVGPGTRSALQRFMKR